MSRLGLIVALAWTGLMCGTVVAQDSGRLTGHVTYAARMALPEGAELLVRLRAPDRAVLAETRIATAGRQVPIPFAIARPDADRATLRAGIAAQGRILWLSAPITITRATPADLGEVVLSRHQPLGYASAFRCGPRLLRLGVVDDGAVLDAGGRRWTLRAVSGGAGQRYFAATDPATRVDIAGTSARVTLAGEVLPDCRMVFPVGDAPYASRGNEPFWSVTLTGGDMTVSRPGAGEVTLRVRDTGLTDTGNIVLQADDGRVTVIRRAELCRDSMTGMPHPETVTLSVENDTFTGCGGDPRHLLTGGPWQVQRIDGREGIDSADATLTFGPAGAYHGSGSCNRYRGQYELTGEGLSFGAAAGTVMAQERRFLDALPAVTRFDLTDQGALLLLEGDTARIIATPVR
jgi:heat shock protein HslJ/uncharacterized lipoprotein YbaY